MSMAPVCPMPLMAGIWALPCNHIGVTQYGVKIHVHNAFVTHSHGCQQQPWSQRLPQWIQYCQCPMQTSTIFAHHPLTDSQVSMLEQLMVILHGLTKGSHKPLNKEQNDHDPPLRVGPSTKHPHFAAPAVVPAATTTKTSAPLMVAELPATTEATKTLILAMTSQPSIINVDTIHNDDTMGISNCSPQPDQSAGISCKTHSMH